MFKSEKIKLNRGIKNQRERNNMTQSELADKLGVSQSMIALYESGKRTPSVDTLIIIADIFKCSLDELCERSTICH